MRPLTEEESKAFFEKLIKFIGRNVTLLIQRTDEPYCFRIQKNKVYYVSEEIMKRSQNIPRESLTSLGTCFGRFTKTGKFKLHITALDYLAQYAKYKVWVKPTSEMSWMYGNNLLKAGLGRITEDTPQNTGVVLFSMNDIPIGFGVTAKSTFECRKLEPTALVVYHYGDVGEYLRDEDSLF
ncbi:60S ribosome subunit biogenesis protein [Tieghemostelium lacteum]|uniref:60S ribosome subunit biogenesis protein NIP7 homolog n=1 Tax=Tieghemostelium lacteum TaxID=361077 RepID=A0A151ZBM8_TIELA|nr:60S ribosome subunit biogenesis protein [Tieghemostelium lacteum]|eukprot:KYQ91341.1 60S ribosome subunit biogenesis protein [Tieghemostelium lacteum]